MNRLGVAAAILASALFTSTAQARVVEQLAARYETNDGPSRWVLTDVTLISGTELNAATNSLAYSTLATYAVVFFTDHQAAVIQLNGSWCYGAADDSCAWGLTAKFLSNLNGRDKGGRQWEFCDPRSNYSCTIP